MILEEEPIGGVVFTHDRVDPDAEIGDCVLHLGGYHIPVRLGGHRDDEVVDGAIQSGQGLGRLQRGEHAGIGALGEAGGVLRHHDEELGGHCCVDVLEFDSAADSDLP